MKYLLDIVYILALILFCPIAIYRRVKHNRYKRGFSDRLGNIKRKNPDKKCIWIHAVSVGEVNQTKLIIEKLNQQQPDLDIVISTTTDTGFDQAQKLYAKDHQVIFFPFDFSWIIEKTFKNINPAICVLVELEIWPNFALTAKRLNIPIVVANGRISDRSFPRYKLAKPVIKKVFQCVSAFLAQTEQYSQRFIELGGKKEKTFVAGTLKYDTAQTNNIAGASQLKKQIQLEDEKLWVIGGTGNNEERIILEVFADLKHMPIFHNLRLAIIPRKPERFNYVAQIIKNRGFKLIRYSQLRNSQDTSSLNKQAVILGDTMGDLRKFYSIASLIFVGRSLVPMGGSDMMEAAAVGVCTIFGKHTDNFRQTVQVLLKNKGAIQIENKSDLLAKAQKCLLEPEFANKIAQAGQKTIIENQGTTDKTVEKIATLLLHGLS